MSTATIDPDTEWTIAKNPDYSHLSWYSTPDGAWEKRLASESVLDKFSGINWNKMPTGDGEYLGNSKVPLFDHDWNEEEYYLQLVPTKTEEQLQQELDEPRQAMEAKLEQTLEDGLPMVWTPTLVAMSSPDAGLPQARKLTYNISPYFQLNAQGYRKSLANTRVCEYRPFSRLYSNWLHSFTDYVIRFQIMRWNLTSRYRMKYFRAAMFVGLSAMFIDHIWSRQYRRKLKWH
jgi:hypothetical protein